MRNRIQIAMICMTPFLISVSYGAVSKQLPEIPNKVMGKFLRAIQDSDWQKALECCSNKIKSKAQQYDSTETFLKVFLPIEEIVAISEFQVSSKQRRGGQYIRYGCEIKLKDPNYRYSLYWNLSILKEDSSWAVEFPTKPLDIWRKHEILKMKIHNDNLPIDMEKSRAGLDVRLIPLTKEFIVGKPMLFRVEMKNISDETLGYTYTSFMVNNPMIVTDSNGIIVPYIAGDAQIGAGSEFVEPGEVIILSDNYDVRSQYHIVTHGKYTFQFKGLHRTKPSNIVKMDVKAGQLSALEGVVEELMPILPNNWGLTRRRIRDITNSDSKGDNGIFVSMIGERGKKGTPGGTIGVFILINPSQSYLERTGHEFELWGQSQWGPVYAKPLNTELLWANYNEQITKALGLESEQKDIDREIILEIEEMPKNTFLRFIKESTNLSDDEKNIIKEKVDSKVYTHVKLVKYKQDGEIFLKIDEFCPRKLIEKDSDGHQQVTGGSGSVSIYRLENNVWSLVESMFYD